MNIKSRNISSLIESQVPQFIVEDYEMFVKFLEAYYAQQELSGGVIDIISNLTDYRDINFYSKNTKRVLENHWYDWGLGYYYFG